VNKEPHVIWYSPTPVRLYMLE